MIKREELIKKADKNIAIRKGATFCTDTSNRKSGSIGIAHEAFEPTIDTKPWIIIVYSILFLVTRPDFC